MDIYQCQICGHEYREDAGEPEMGIAPGTPWEKVPEGSICPICGAEKRNFRKI
jgi:rubredoxin